MPASAATLPTSLLPASLLPASLLLATLALATLSLIGIAMSVGMVGFSRAFGRGGLRVALAGLGLLAFATFTGTGLVAMRAMARGVGAG